jgi:hypothetical protein
MLVAIGMCCPANKVPLVRGGVHAATRDLATIERWWQTWPRADVAIACGAPSGVAIDIDVPSQVPELFNLATLRASTPSGGRHLYCRYVEGIRNRVLDWGEVRSTGLYVVAPPAIGREWLNNSAIADVPEFRARIVPKTPTVTSLVPSGSWVDAITDHRKTVARWSREESFALVAYRNATSRVLSAKHRMIALNAETYALGRLVGRGWIARSDVVPGTEAASRHNGLIAKRGLEVVRAVILGALAKGAARPYPDLTPRR